jgi:hypothetical protein
LDRIVADDSFIQVDARRAARRPLSLPPTFGNGGPGVKWPLPSPKGAAFVSGQCEPLGLGTATKDCHCFSHARTPALPPMRRALPLITGVSLALLPKCPLCFAAYAGVLGIGLWSASALPVLRWGLTAAVTGATILVLVNRHVPWRVQACLIAGSAALIAGSCLAFPEIGTAVGLVFLAAGATWNWRS